MRVTRLDLRLPAAIDSHAYEKVTDVTQPHASYEIFEQIGVGEDTVVYRGHDLHLGRDVAVKELKSEVASDPRRRDRFLNEAKFLAQFDHPAILRIHAVEPERGWIVMDLMKGSLEKQIRQAALPAETVRSILCQLLPALTFLHERGKLHGSIRPSNILIDEKGRVKLSDFEESDHDGELRAPTGTKKYLAPELIRGEFGSVGAATDLYCLGFTALELLAGPAFEKKVLSGTSAAIDADVAWLRWHSGAEPYPSAAKIARNVPAELVQVIDGLLVKAVEERIATAEEAATILGEQAVVPVVVVDPPASDVDTATSSRETPSMLPASVREIEPLANQPGGSAEPSAATKWPATSNLQIGQAAGKAVTAGAVGGTANTQETTGRERANEILGKPYVLYPLCTAILFGALMIGLTLRNRESGAETGSELARKPNPTESESSKEDAAENLTGDAQASEPEPEVSSTVDESDRVPPDFLSEPPNDLVTPEPDEALDKEHPRELWVELEPEGTKQSPSMPETATEAEVAESGDEDPTTAVSDLVANEETTTEEGAVTEENLIAGDDSIASELVLNEPVESESAEALEPPILPRLEFVSTQVDITDLVEEFEGEAELVIDSGGFIASVSDVAISPDGKLLAAAGEKVVRLWDLESGRLVETLRGDRARTSYGNCDAVEFSRDGQYIVVGVNDYQPHGSIRVYNVDNLTEIEALLPGHTAPVRKLGFSRDGKWMSSVDADGQVAIWDWAARKVLKSAPPRAASQPIFDELHFPGTEPVLAGIDFQGPMLMSAPDLRQLTGHDKLPSKTLAWIMDVLTRKLAYPFNANQDPRVMDLQLDQGAWAAAGKGSVHGDNKFWVGVWNAREVEAPIQAQPSTVYSRHKWNITSIDISPEHGIAASGDKFGEIHVWNMDTGDQLHLFRGQGKPIYEAAFDRNSKRIAFGTNPFKPDTWARNNYGEAENVIDLESRAIYSAAEVEDLDLVQEQPRRGATSLQIIAGSGEANMAIEKRVGGRSSSKYDFTTGRNPTVFSLLDAPVINVPVPALVGDNLGLLAVWDTDTEELRRAFVGHEGLVSAISKSPRGNMILSASADRTLRIWSLEDHQPTGKLDFKFENSLVTSVDPGSSSARAGVRVGDRVLELDGISIAEMYRRMLDGNFDYRPGQIVPVTMKRDGQPYTFDMTLAEGYDFVDPLLSIFIGNDGQWIIWTPRGYYDASPGAEQLIGWHLNRGPDKSARFFQVQQFRKQLYRPDIINRILSGSKIDVAIAEANAAIHEREAVDFRSPSDIALRHPPRIEFVSPKRGAEVNQAEVEFEAVVSTANGLPITEVTLLVNGVASRVFTPKDSGGQRLAIHHRISLQPGRNDLELIAANAESTSASRAIYVTASLPDEMPELDKPASKLTVLAIGISDYAQAASEFQNLPLAASDARAFATTAKRQSGGRLYAEVLTRELTNEQATRTEILDGLQWLVDNTNDGDTAAIFIAAHGFVDSTHNFYVGTHEVDVERPRATAISWREFTQTLHEDLPSCRRLVFLDLHPTEQAISPDIRNPLLDLAAPELATIFFSSTSLQQASLPHPPGSQGFCTAALSMVLADPEADIEPEEPDSLLNAQEVSSAWTAAVRKLSTNHFYPVAFAPDSSKQTAVLQSYATRN